jgi:hypothetical protein
MGLVEPEKFTSACTKSRLCKQHQTDLWLKPHWADVRRSALIIFYFYTVVTFFNFPQSLVILVRTCLNALD